MFVTLRAAMEHHLTIVVFDFSDAMLTVTLWGDHAINFNVEHVYDEKAGNVIVALFVGCIPRRDYKDYGLCFPISCFKGST